MKKNEIERRYIAFSACGITATLRAAAKEGEAEKPVVDGTAILYNRMTKLYEDDQFVINEIITPRAATEALKEPEQVLLWNHDASQPMAARKNNTLTVNEDDEGVHISADLSGSAWGRDGYEAIRSGLVDAMSFAFLVDPTGMTRAYTKQNGKYVVTRTINKFSRILDFSPVTYPAYKDTEISARGREVDEEEVRKEIALRESAQTKEKINALLGEFKEY
jgi:HK97 family phage prohead protease